jgi:O-acetylhomoserine/O-acetylserine sulfhydrylase-like pyridoxal-dependent enzyme
MYDPVMDDGFTTRAIRAATRVPRVDQPPSSVPIYQAATFASADADELGEVTTGRRPGYVYARLGNPTVDVLLHEADAGFAASGASGSSEASARAEANPTTPAGSATRATA